MPRQYNIRPGGPAAPNVGQFGSAEIGLQSPTFRAQTAVDAGDNPFEYLQKILGVAGAITSEVIDQKTNDVKGQIAMIRMEEERQREAMAEERSARAEARYAKTEQREAEIERERQLRQEATAWENDYNSRIATLRASGNVEGLDQLRSELIKFQETAKKSGNPYLFDSAGKLLTTADASFSLVENRIEEDNNKREMAAAQAASEKASGLLLGFRERMLVNTELSEGIFRGDPASWRNAIEAQAIQSMVEEDPQFVDTVWKNGSPAEKKAFERVLRSETAQIYTDFANRRAAIDRTAAANQEADALIEQGRESPEAAIQSVDDSYMNGRLTEGHRKKALEGIVDSHVRAAPTEQGRILRAIDIAVQHSSDGIIAPKAAAMLGKSMGALGSELQKNRLDPVTTGLDVDPNPNGDEVGWRVQFDTQQELVDWFMQKKMGIAEADSTDPKYSALNPLVSGLLRQFEEDSNATEANARRRLSSESRSPTIRSQRMANDGWEASNLKAAIDSRAYLRMTPAEIDSLVAAEKGFKGNEPPLGLMQAVSGMVDDDKSFHLVKSFFQNFPPSLSGVNTRMAEDSNLRDAWVKSIIYLDTINTMQGEENQVLGVAKERYSRYKSRDTDANMTKEDKDRMNKNIENGMREAFQLDDVSSTSMFSEDLLLARSLIDVHLSSGGSPETAGSFARTILLRDMGYSEIPVTVNGVSKVDLVYNKPITYGDGTVLPILPSRDVMSGTNIGGWKDYLDSMKPIASQYIGSLKIVGGAEPVTEVVDISINPDPLDMMAYSACSIIATTKNGKRYVIPPDKARASFYGFQMWQRESKKDTERLLSTLPPSFTIPSYTN